MQNSGTITQIFRTGIAIACVKHQGGGMMKNKVTANQEKTKWGDFFDGSG